MPVIAVVVPAPEAEVAGDLLWQAGASAVSETGLDGARVRLVADVTVVPPVPERWVLEEVEPDDRDLDAWRAWARPHRAGRHLVVQPAWLDPVLPRPDDIVLVIDPGRAFGSGAHPSTLLALAALEDVALGGAHVLDVGCGSGVLSVAAARLGAEAVVAVDLDPAAVAATIQNAEANGVRGRVQGSTRPLSEVVGAFDLVVANIGLRVLCELAPHLDRRVAPGATAILSGLLDGQVDDAVAAHAGGDEVARPSLDGWSAVVLRY